MLKTFYISAWILVAIAAVASFWSGYYDSAMLVALSLTVLVLVYALALWSVFTNPNDAKLEIFRWDGELRFEAGKQ